MNFWEFLLFTLQSSVEYTAMLIFVFCLFRINFSYYKYHVAFVCLSLSYISYTMRVDGLSTITPLVQLTVLVLFLWLLFQIQIFYAAILAVTGYFSYAVIQTIIVFVLHLTNIIEMSDLEPLKFANTLVALSSGLVTLLLSMLIKRKNWGFAFVPHNPDQKINLLKRENITFLIIVISSIIMTSLAYYFSLVVKSSFSILIALLVLIFLVTLLLYFAMRKDRKDADDFD